MDLIQEAKRVFDIEINALKSVRDSLNSDFLSIIDAITNCKGKVIITGMGKPGHIGRKIAATMASLGTASFFLHPAEALHGDLGMIGKEDVVIAISYSGESEEVTRLLSNIKAIGATLIGISGNKESALIKHCDISQVFTKFDEACYMGLAPTSSTTVSLVYGDALAVVASKLYGFNENNYGLYHPAGSLGKKLFIKVKDIMASDHSNAVVLEGETLKNAIIEMGKKGLGMVTVIDSNAFIKGVITDGDLRRLLEKGVDVYNLMVNEVMSQKPTILIEEMMAIEALQILKQKNISSAPIMNKDKQSIGTIRLQDILNAGIVL